MKCRRLKNDGERDFFKKEEAGGGGENGIAEERAEESEIMHGGGIKL